jgi:hypothetical protein
MFASGARQHVREWCAMFASGARQHVREWCAMFASGARTLGSRFDCHGDSRVGHGSAAHGARSSCSGLLAELVVCFETRHRIFTHATSGTRALTVIADRD